MAGETQATFWTATVTGLGSQNPDSVAFTKSSNFPTTWEEVMLGTDVFIKFPKIYRKVNTVSSNQITSFTISNSKIDDDYVLYPCFIDESNNELDYILIGKYMSKSSHRIDSVNSSESVKDNSIDNGRIYCRNKGTGYQLMDWRMQRLWQDLLICAMETVNTNGGSGIDNDEFGIHWGAKFQWIDGVYCNAGTYFCSNSPSEYHNGAADPPASYSAISYSAPLENDVEIMKLGYDGNKPFFNYPSETYTDTTYQTYYCDGYRGYSTVIDSVKCDVGISAKDSGAFYCRTNDSITCGLRLCYRPLTPTLEAGTYRFIDNPVSPTTTLNQTVTFTSSNENFVWTQFGSDGTFYYGTPDVLVFENGAWKNDGYKTVIFSTAQSVSADFYKWAITDGNLIKQSFYQFKHFYQKDLVGSGSYQFRQFTPTALPDKLATPTNVTVDGTTVSWDEVTNATSYDVYVDNAVYETITTCDGGGDGGGDVTTPIYEIENTNLKIINTSYEKQGRTLKLL